MALTASRRLPSAYSRRVLWLGAAQFRFICSAAIRSAKASRLSSESASGWQTAMRASPKAAVILPSATWLPRKVNQPKVFIGIFDLLAKLVAPAIRDHDFSAVSNLVYSSGRGRGMVRQKICGRLVLCLILRASWVIRAVVAENAAIHAQFSLCFRRDVRQLPKQGVEPLGVLPFQILFCLLLQGCEVLRGSLLCGRALIGKDGDLFAIASLLVLP